MRAHRTIPPDIPAGKDDKDNHWRPKVPGVMELSLSNHQWPECREGNAAHGEMLVVIIGIENRCTDKRICMGIRTSRSHEVA